MTRLYRLFSPGIVFFILGLFVVAYGNWNWFEVRGGLTTFGCYVLALQIVLTALLIFGIDDLSGGGLWHRVGRGTGELLRISARPISFWRALVEFYRRPFWPAFLFGFGLAASLSAFAAGVFQEKTSLVPDYTFFVRLGMHRSEALLGAILLLGAAFLWWRGSASYFGWVIGVCLATMAGQLLFVYSTNNGLTAESWGGFMIGLCLLRLLALAAARVLHTRFSS